MSLQIVCIIFSITLCLSQGSHCLSCDSLQIGERYELNVSLTSPASLCITLSDSLQSEAIRVLVSSENATTRHPVLVTVRQPMGVVSWAIPYVESGYVHRSVERTLCPLLNRGHDDEPAVLLIDLSTSQSTSLSVSLATTLVQPFKVTMNNSVTVQASPSGPSYLMYEAPPTDSRVRVRFQSSDITSDICAIASIQTGYCPVVELLDNPDHRGRYQTMKRTAAINTRVSEFFYVVVTVFPSDGRDGGCVFSEGGELIRLDDFGINYNRTLYSAGNRTKTITISVEPALSDSGYAIAIVVATIIYASFYIVAIVWILVFDWGWYHTHFIIKQLTSNPRLFAEPTIDDYEEEESTPERNEDSSDKKTGPVKQDSSDEEEEHYNPPPTTQTGEDTPDFSLRFSLRKGAGHHQSDSSGKLIKRPSMLSVLRGTHLNLAIDEVTPPASQYPSPFPNGRSRHNSEQYPSLTPAASPHGGAHLMSVRSLNPNVSSLAPLRFKRQKSVSESYATPTSHSLTASLGGPMMSVTSPIRSHDTRSMLRGRKSKSVSSPDVTDAGVPVTTETGEPDLRTDDVEEAGESIRRQVSYMTAVEEGVVSQKEYYDFPVNVSLAEAGDIDDSAFVQKKYNHYALYLLVVIVFYSIPAYQLVVTSQRLLTTSGNEDICYYNSLCAHLWDVYPGLSLSAFNNIFSNIGFFVLGLLYLFITYRRRTVYESFEKYNCSRAREERVGIPQHFGIHYAIGLALMAEALMSVAYHICPSNTNYQFDTTFMYIMAALGLLKLLENRCPDLEAGLHKIMLTIAFIIVVVVVGVLYSYSLVFWILFFVIYVVFAFVFSVEVYYRWQLQPRSVRDLFILYRREGLWPPRHTPKFVMAIISILFNWAFGLVLVATRPVDFGTMFLFIILSNFILYLFYYAITKMVYHEIPSVKPLIFVILAVLFWAGAIFFYTRSVTDWTVSPALSRDINAECYLLGFYDAHDLWHFLSAFALFFSFLMLMMLDDKQEDCPRKTLRAF